MGRFLRWFKATAGFNLAYRRPGNGVDIGLDSSSVMGQQTAAKSLRIGDWINETTPSQIFR
jgi:hypothetical protein